MTQFLAQAFNMDRPTLLFGTLVVVCVAFTYAFTNPIKTQNGSDPQMVWWDGMYYLTTTTWSDIQITAAPTIEGLKTATPRTVWTDNDPSRCCNVWAPEMHMIDGRWYIYYTAGPSGDDYTGNQRTWVIQGGTEDPLSSEYTFLSQVVPPNYQQGMLDPSVFRMSNGKTYYLFSAWPSSQTIFIADLIDPSTIGPATQISEPTLEWETHQWAVNEGPYGISHNGTDFVVFSASSCGTQYYSIGLLTLTAGADPLDAHSWTKSPEPIFSSANGLYGTAHNAFFKSPDSTEDWNVFHANRSPDGHCDGNRQTFVQKVDWNADGTPNLGTPLAAGTEIAEPSGE
ncbi:glycosyl hydrolase [Lineolata rhizophorae]|uniref:Glycosyl hydrolase n=1 Tax=Lineolata rhizophorae TaxID=578093 RepID=A0A6A6P592_9PEZI|nr:glycosyl hydrolase [Lineolata rhizophorae]